MSKFKIGDIVVANEQSNERYSVTAKKNNFIGKVTAIYSSGDMEVITINICDSQKEYIGHKFYVDKDYFDLSEEIKEEEPLPAEPETEHSIPLQKIIELVEDDEILSGKAKRHLIKKLKEIEKKS